MRDCDVCRHPDNGPRHIHSDPTGAGDTIRHLACCARAGCPSGICTTPDPTQKKD